MVWIQPTLQSPLAAVSATLTVPQNFMPSVPSAYEPPFFLGALTDRPGLASTFTLISCTSPVPPAVYVVLPCRSLSDMPSSRSLRSYLTIPHRGSVRRGSLSTAPNAAESRLGRDDLMRRSLANAGDRIQPPSRTVRSLRLPRAIALW